MSTRSFRAQQPQILDRMRVIDRVRNTRLAHIQQMAPPESLVDKSATEQLASAMTNIITSGALDHVSREGTACHELSNSRLGFYGDPGLAQMVLDELKTRGLARESKDGVNGVSIPMHPAVRHLILVLLSQILRPKGTALGFDLSPATDRPQLIGALTERLSLPSIPSCGHGVSLDLATVGVDLSTVPRRRASRTSTESARSAPTRRSPPDRVHTPLDKTSSGAADKGGGGHDD